MLLALVVLVASTSLQLAAAVIAIRLMRITGWKWAWGLVAAGIALMAARRGYLLYQLLLAGPSAEFDPVDQTLGLVISACLFVGLAGIVPLFRAFNRSEEELRTAQTDLERRVRDRTAELAAANESLQQEHYLLHTLMDYLPHKIYFKDTQSRFLRVNKSMAHFFGLQDPRETLGKTDVDFFTDEHALQALADEQEIVRSGKGIIDKEEKETWPDGHARRASAASFCAVISCEMPKVPTIRPLSS